MTINERIKEIRVVVGVTQDVFAERIGITKSSVSMLESGRNNPSEQTLRLICREYGVDYIWLKTGVGEMYDQSDPVEDDMALFHNLMASGDEVAKALFRAYAKKFDGRWHLVREFLEEVLADAAEQENGEKKDEP